MGFVLECDEAKALIAADPRNADVIFPYINGEDLNSRPDCSASRWVINFRAMTDTEACRYELPWEIVDRKVRPERQRTNPDGSFILRKPLPQRWWQYAEKRLALYQAISDLTRVLVIARNSRTGKPAFVPTNQVLNEKLVIFATDKGSDLAILSSEIHSVWAWEHSATLKTDLQYTPSDCFQTFPSPQENTRLQESGQELDSFRRKIMKSQKFGLTNLYDELNKESNQDIDIVRLRETHVEIDEAVRESYAFDEERQPQIREFEASIASAPLPSWREMDLGHGFHDTPQGTRFTISPQARVDVLDKLLALNYYRYDQEVKCGLHNKKSRGNAKTPTVDIQFPDDGLFSPPDALF